LALTNRHVVDAIEKLPKHPATGQGMVGAFLFFSMKTAKDANFSAFRLLAIAQLERFLQANNGTARRFLTSASFNSGLGKILSSKLAMEKFSIQAGHPIYVLR
jgi:hypothetical protein